VSVPRLKDHVREFLAKLPEEPPLSETPIEMMRSQFRELMNATGASRDCASEDMEIDGAFGVRRVRVHNPAVDERALQPALIYAHGGGWIVGDLGSEDESLSLLATALGHPLISLDYVLAPEHPFPAPLDDVVALFQEIRRRAPSLGIDARRLALGGTSAGANLSLAAALRLLAAGEAPPAALLLMSGLFDARFEFPSFKRLGRGFLLTEEDLTFFRRLYCPNNEQWADWRVSPLQGDLRGLPPTLMLAAEADPLVDDSIILAERLRAADVIHELHIEPGQIHAWTSFVGVFPDAGASLKRAAATIRTWLLAPKGAAQAGDEE